MLVYLSILLDYGHVTHLDILLSLLDPIVVDPPVIAQGYGPGHTDTKTGQARGHTMGHDRP